MASNFISDAASPSTYGDTSGFNSANSGGINWMAALKTLGEGSEDKVSGALSPVASPNLPAPQARNPGSPVGRPGAGISLRELLDMMSQQQLAYQQAAHGPAIAGGPPQMKPRALGLLGI